jgi:hypothetical protein
MDQTQLNWITNFIWGKADSEGDEDEEGEADTPKRPSPKKEKEAA